MLLENFLPTLPDSPIITAILVVAWLSVVLMIYSIFVEAEHRRDLIRIVAGSGLLAYGIVQQDLLVLVLGAGIGIASLIEFIEIMLGYHKHTPHEIKEYIKRYKKKI